MEGGVTSQEWVDKLQGGGYRSGVDYPISLFYKSETVKHNLEVNITVLNQAFNVFFPEKS